MDKDDVKYLLFLVLHIAIGILLFLLPDAAGIYAIVILVGGLLYVFNKQNSNNEVLLVAAYVVGSEAFLRMTGGNLVYEFSKYAVIIFMTVGIYLRGVAYSATPYWIFLCLLIPGVIVATQTLNYDTEIRKTISFNISGPVCLGIAAIYCYRRKITLEHITDILLAAGLPIVSMTVYLILYTPDIKEVIMGTSSNFETSGGFGPNQVATVLGLGMFVFFSRLVFASRSTVTFIVNLSLAFVIGYRGLITFSRGGMITGLAMLVALLVITYFRINSKGKVKMNFLWIAFGVALVAVWSYSSIQTQGLIDKRYSNQDAAGRVKESRFTGREEIAATELDYFLESPLLGVGVAKGAELREATGDRVLSHNEITRMMAEHGTLGIIALMILFITPLVLYFGNTHNLYVVCFLIFWILTINHAAMRLAAPAFIYALSLLKVVPDEEIIVHRE
ncbi:MAG TPA: O-antigen ligase family protein [Flavobacterium sp.]|jgi:hypothetical protein